MRLMDEPLSKQAKDHNLDMLHVIICRICVTDDPEELVRSLGFANDYLATLAYSRMLQLKQGD